MLAGFVEGLDVDGREACLLTLGLAAGILDEFLCTSFFISDFVEEGFGVGLDEGMTGFADGEVVAGLAEGLFTPGFEVGLVVGLVEGWLTFGSFEDCPFAGLTEGMEVGRVSLVFAPGRAEGRYPSGYFLLKSAEPCLRVSG